MSDNVVSLERARLERDMQNEGTCRLSTCGAAADLAGIATDAKTGLETVAILAPAEGQGWMLTPGQAFALARRLRDYACRARQLNEEMKR